MSEAYVWPGLYIEIGMGYIIICFKFILIFLKIYFLILIRPSDKTYLVWIRSIPNRSYQIAIPKFDCLCLLYLSHSKSKM